MVDGDLEYEVESILSHRFVGHNKLEYLVKWLGYGVEHNTWEPSANCANCPQLVSDYWAKVEAQADTARVSKRKQSAAAAGSAARSKRAKQTQNSSRRLRAT